MNHYWWLLLGPVCGFFQLPKNPPGSEGPTPHPPLAWPVLKLQPKGRLKDIIQEQHGIAEDRQLLCYKGTFRWAGWVGFVASFADLFQIRNWNLTQLWVQFFGPIFFVEISCLKQPTMEFFRWGTRGLRVSERVFAFFSPILTISSWNFQLWQLVTSIFKQVR